MSSPDWRTMQGGARVRAAAWLHAEVGEGGIFTKADLRAAFPGVEQIDRRVRDLRSEGWSIATNREDASLLPEQLRLTAEGGRVWEPGYRSKAIDRLSDAERQAVFAADNHVCVRCGVEAGGAFADDPLRNAQIVAARVESSSKVSRYVTLCTRCNSARGDGKVTYASVLQDFSKLPAEDKEKVRHWMLAGDRAWTPAEKVWSKYSRLSAAERKTLVEEISENESAGHS